MATYKTIKRECDKLNRRQRNLREYLLYSLGQFWEQAGVEGSSALIGGQLEKRLLVLENMLIRNFKNKGKPIVIFSELQNDITFLEDLYSIQEKLGGRLFITSEENNNYSFFAEWSQDKMIDFFIDCAKIKNLTEGIVNLHNYIMSFFEIAKNAYPSKNLWYSIMQAEKNFDQLSKKVKKENVDKQYLQYFERRSGNETLALKSILLTLKEALYPMFAEDGYCISVKEFRPGDIIVISKNNIKNRDIVSLYFIYEIQNMKREIFFYPIILEWNDAKFIDFWEELRKEIDIGYCVKSINRFLSKKNEVEISGFKNVVILFDQYFETGLDQELRILGEMDYYEPISGGGTPPVAFSFWTSNDVHIGCRRRNKVTSEDIGNNKALFYGHLKNFSQHEIALIKEVNFKIDI